PKVVCGENCCDACDADNTACCEASKVCGEGENKICCGEDEVCAGDVCCASDKKCGENCCSDGQECKNGTTCCDIIDKSKCPNGTMIASDSCEICKCDSDTECSDGQVLMKNYVDGVGACGEVCCEMKEEPLPSSGNRNSVQSAYKVIGAIRGVCCGGYTSEEFNYGIDGDGNPIDPGSSTMTYSLKENDGYYCASTYDMTGRTGSYIEKTSTWFADSANACYKNSFGPEWVNDPSEDYHCSSSTRGNPGGSSMQYCCIGEVCEDFTNPACCSKCFESR
ncbi:MAG: hypothetical protein J6U64_00695, partial [Alphaproteobacteria bacterium]|nr:hypothetical protein [Alphaproteobacteria bacterium]